MGELQTEYGDRVDFVLVPPAETLQRGEEIKGFGFEAELHGLVAFDAEGNEAAKLPGHSFGKDAIREAIEKALPN